MIRYQGKEKSIVLVSMVRHDGYDPLRSGNQPRRRSSKANVARFEFIGYPEFLVDKMPKM